MSETPVLQNAFPQPSAQMPSCGLPVPRLVALYHAGTGLLLDMVGALLRSHEAFRVGDLYGAMRAGDLLISDHGLSLFAHLANSAKQGGMAYCAVIRKSAAARKA